MCTETEAAEDRYLPDTVASSILKGSNEFGSLRFGEYLQRFATAMLGQ